jgi:mono/diheme cytochrome c family protein
MIKMRTLLLLLCAAPAWADVTYSKEISRILEARCQGCHRPGDIGPMSLMNYDDAVAYAPDILRVINEGIMPPWKPSESHGKFKGATALKPEEKADLLTWLNSDMPMGNVEDMPAAPEERGAWILGEPDLVVKMPIVYAPERGKDIYRCFVLPSGLTEDKFVQAMDILPGDRRIVHHVIAYLDPNGDSEKLDEKDPEPGYDCYGGPGFEIDENLINLLVDGFTLGGWAPGARPQLLPEGIGMKLSRKARIVMQIHYNTLGRRGEDQTSIGLYFNKTEVKKQMLFLPIFQSRLNIPAGNPNVVASTTFTVPLGMQALNIFPHMHLLGTKIEVEKRYLGERETMISIPAWDFNWQGAYTFENPVKLPLLSQISLRCTYDNSINNPRNPSNPLKNVKWGEGTEDEMCLAFMGIIFGL